MMPMRLKQSKGEKTTCGLLKAEQRREIEEEGENLVVFF